MANSVFYDRVKVGVSAAPGTSAVPLGPAIAAFQSFTQANVADGALVSYVIEDGANFEVGQGTYSASANTLARTTIGASSAGTGIAISATALAVVSITLRASDIAAIGAAASSAAGAAPTFNFVRLAMNENNGGNRYEMSEIRFYDLTATQVFPTSATAPDSFQGANNAIDGNPNTNWVGATDAPENFDCAFSSPFSPGSIEIDLNDSGGYSNGPILITPYFSADGGTTLKQQPNLTFKPWSASLTTQTALLNSSAKSPS